MRIYTFVEQYPCPYKPYYDAQFVDLLRKGHELTIFAITRMDRSTLNEKVGRYRLAEHIRYMPTILRTIPARLPIIAAGAAALGRRVPERARAAAATERGVLARTKAALRALARGAERPDVCLVHSLGAAALVPWLHEIYPGVPVALYYHGGEVPQVQPLRQDVAAHAFALADIVFTNTDFSRRHAIERGCPPERVAVLPVGLPLEDYVVPGGRAYRPDGTLRLLSAGRMSEEKGIIFALQALVRVVERGERNIRYSLTGDGYLRPRLEAYVRENGLEPYVRFLGVLSTAGVLEAMGNADALLLPSIQVGNWVENQACAVQEALLMGALVVTSRTGGVPESIPPEMERFVVPPGDPAALAEALLRLAAMPAAAIQAEAATCRRFVTERYDVSRLNDQLLARTIGAGRDRPPAGVVAA